MKRMLTKMFENVARSGIVLAVLLSVALPAHAQQTTYDVKTINFDLWCQEQAHLAPDRCDKRLPEDEAQFEAYRAKVEKYEIPYLQAKEREQLLDTNILHNDPIDDPVDKRPAQPVPSTVTRNNP
jgi:hypothetical protein